MHRHTTFRIGGRAGLYIVPADENGLAAAVKEHPDAVIVGGGSNILVSDEGVPAVISTAGLTCVKWHAFDGQSFVTAGGGCNLTELSREAYRRGFGGLEFAFGIPGTVGGAVVMNAGAHGGEVKDRLENVRLLVNGAFETVPVSKLGLAYRSNALPKGAVVVSATFAVAPDAPEAVLRRMKEGSAARKKSQPLEFPSAGSVFKNPPGGYAGMLIEQAGLKGTRIGDAQVSGKHANFIVNLGKATAREVLELMEKMEAAVREKTGIRLEREIRLVGNF